MAPLRLIDLHFAGLERAIGVYVVETDDGELLYGWYCRAEHPIASALYCHGNTGNGNVPGLYGTMQFQRRICREYSEYGE